MIKLERVFQLADPQGKYQNIRITAEAETPEECIEQIYRTYYLERIFFQTLVGNVDGAASAKEVLGNIPEIINSLNAEV